MRRQFYAHTLKGHPPSKWQPLDEHLTSVGALAARFAESFDAAEWARTAGLWHDLGKYRPAFQTMLHDVLAGKPKAKVDHSTPGAVHARQLFRQVVAGRAETLHLLVTAIVAGHHGGLPEDPRSLDLRLQDKAALLDDVSTQEVPPAVLHPRLQLDLPRVLRNRAADFTLALDFLVRMVFSVLVDADRLNTERFTEALLPRDARPSHLRRGFADIPQLKKCLDEAIDRKVSEIDPTRMAPAERTLYRYRQRVLDACRNAAKEKPGVFSLDVATGGGKTLSSLTFALRHAEHHGKRRVIVVIPFTSIIEQTAAVFREALAEEASNVLEHHSAVGEDDPLDDPGSATPEAVRLRLATENWDAPIIVTTAVQFFESLLSARPSRCRKLHNIADSVVVLDEAQTLPPRLLNPTVWLLNELASCYGTTVVVSTATQPALEEPFPALLDVRAIVPESVERPPARVRVEVLDSASISWPELANELVSHEQVLCITHRRADAQELTQTLDQVLAEESALHLSATMCPEHRSQRLDEIRRRLQSGDRCRVVSTQLVEAGVDLDFPVVYRALSGLDSLAQAAGRANREGRLGVEGGLLRVFRPPTEPPDGLPRLAASAADALVRGVSMEGRAADLLSPELARAYFREYYGRIGDKDGGGITSKRREHRFRDVERDYTFIRDGGVAIWISFDERARALLDELRSPGKSGRRPDPQRLRELLRALQRYTVTVFPHTLEKLLRNGHLESLTPYPTEHASLFAIRTCSEAYGDRFGLSLSAIDQRDYEANIT